MARCIVCGKKGFFLKVNREGACVSCKQKEEEIEKKLLRYISALEKEDKAREWGVAPWPYEMLACMYRRKNDHRKEVAILERFAAQKYVAGPQAERLLERLKEVD